MDKDAVAGYQNARFARDKSVFCHAPFGSMNFEQTGNVTACCYNRKNILGTYPQQSLKEMWNSPAAKELRDQMRAFTLPEGCWLCGTQLQARNFNGLRALYFDELGSHPEGEHPELPLMMEFELSNVCNLECVMCFGKFSSLIRRNREKLSALQNPYDDAFVEQLDDFFPSLMRAKFLGGEPFLNSMYFRIWERMARVNNKVDVHIISNCTTLNSKVLAVLERNNPTLALSIDSMDPENYERIRVNADYDVMRANLEVFLQYSRANQKNLYIIVCPMIQNWMDLPGLVEFGNRKGILVRYTTVIDPPQCSLRYRPVDELQSIVGFLEASIPPGDSPIARENNKTYLDMIRQIRHWEQFDRPSPAEARV